MINYVAKNITADSILRVKLVAQLNDRDVPSSQIIILVLLVLLLL